MRKSAQQTIADYIYIMPYYKGKRIMDRNLCNEHMAHAMRITNVEMLVNKLDNRLWAIVILLLCNLGGIIGIIFSLNKLLF